MVVFVDDEGYGVPIHEKAFNEPLTIEAAERADYSNFDDCETAEEAAANYTGEIIEFNPDEYENVIEF